MVKIRTLEPKEGITIVGMISTIPILVISCQQLSFLLLFIMFRVRQGYKRVWQGVGWISKVLNQYFSKTFLTC